MKIGELISRTQALYSSGIPSDDIRLSAQLIYSKLLSVRGKLISQTYSKKQKISDWYYETLNCIELIQVPKHECPCLPATGCMILRSKYKLPTPLTGLANDLIRFVSSVDLEIKIDPITINAYKSQRGNKYTSRKLNYFIQEGFLYISTPKRIKAVMMQGLFENPIDVAQFQGLCDCTTCDSCIDYREIEFPIGLDMVDTLLELVAQELVSLYKQIPSDNYNDSVESTQQIK